MQIRNDTLYLPIFLDWTRRVFKGFLGGHRHRMVVGLTTTFPISTHPHQSCEFESSLWRGALDTTLCDNVCQWLAPIKHRSLSLRHNYFFLNTHPYTIPLGVNIFKIKIYLYDLKT